MKRTTNKIGTTAMKDKRLTAETRVVRVVPMMRKEEVAAPHKLPKAAIPTLSLESKKVQTLQKLRKPTINSLWNTILTKEGAREDSRRFVMLMRFYQTNKRGTTMISTGGRVKYDGGGRGDSTSLCRPPSYQTNTTFSNIISISHLFHYLFLSPSLAPITLSLYLNNEERKK